MIKKSGNTPLHLAITGECLELVFLLLKLGASVNATNNDGETPLHYAAETDSVTSIMLLAKNGAVLNAEDEDGKTPAQWASEAENSNALRLLIALGAPPPSFDTIDSDEDDENDLELCDVSEFECDEEDLEDELDSDSILQEIEAL